MASAHPDPASTVPLYTGRRLAANSKLAQHAKSAQIREEGDSDSRTLPDSNPSRCVAPLSEAQLPVAGVLLSTKWFFHRGGPSPACYGHTIASSIESNSAGYIVGGASGPTSQVRVTHSLCGFWFDAPALAAVGLVSSAKEGGSRGPLPLRSPETATHATESWTRRGRLFGHSRRWAGLIGRRAAGLHHLCMDPRFRVWGLCWCGRHSGSRRSTICVAPREHAASRLRSVRRQAPNHHRQPKDTRKHTECVDLGAHKRHGTDSAR